jgi:hypothetical protein
VPVPALDKEPSAGGLAERPIRTRRMASASNAPTLRETERSAAVPQLSKSTSMPSGLTIGKTRSQSRRMATGEAVNYPPAAAPTTQQKLAALPEERRTVSRSTTLRCPLSHNKFNPHRMELADPTARHPRALELARVWDSAPCSTRMTCTT